MSSRHRDRARRRRRPGEPSTYDGVRDEAIYERDRWTCRMPVCTCPGGRRIDPSLASPHQWSASIDHIIPVSEGGPDTAGNKRAAHSRCNVKDQARRQREENRAVVAGRANLIPDPAPAATMLRDADRQGASPMTAKQDTNGTERTATWDGRNLGVIQALLTSRLHGEPPYRTPGGDFTRLEIYAGFHGKGDGIPGQGWTPVQPGTTVTVNDAAIVSLHPAEYQATS